MTPEIPVYFSNTTFKHTPQVEVHLGDEVMHADQVERAESILLALKKYGFDCLEVTGKPDLTAIQKVHGGEYLAFLSDASKTIRGRPSLDSDCDGAVPAIYPSTFPYTNNQKPRHIEGTIGRFAYDTYTPIMASTFEAAQSSVQSAIAASQHVLTDRGVVYALTRPPGHHAMREKMGGYCYMNNAAIAAEYLIGQGVRRVTIFDPDLHHGNGIQEYAWERPDVQYVSIHADPSFCYPFYSGYEDEIGEGPGKGTIVNYPLGHGTGEKAYHRVAQQAIGTIVSFDPEVLIVAMGFDTHKDDPFRTFRLSTSYYQTLANDLADLGLPTIILQEGGYNIKTLGANVVSFLRGFTL